MMISKNRLILLLIIYLLYTCYTAQKYQMQNMNIASKSHHYIKISFNQREKMNREIYFLKFKSKDYF